MSLLFKYEKLKLEHEKLKKMYAELLSYVDNDFWDWLND